MTERDGLLPVLRANDLASMGLHGRRRLAAGASGTVVHEIGHFLVAAKQGFPTDFIMFDWSAGATKHGILVHERYRDAQQSDEAGQVQMLIAGYCAELCVFDEGLLNRAASDLEAAGALQGKGRFDLERDAKPLAARLARSHNPFTPEDGPVIIDFHNWIAAAINAEGGPDDIFVIPNYRVPARFRRPVPLLRRIRSYRESRKPSYILAARERLLDNSDRSGV